MVEKLNMFEFCSEDTMKAVTSEAPTSTKWVDVRKMNHDGEEFMRSRLVARDFRPRRGGTGQARPVRGDASTGGEERCYSS